MGVVLESRAGAAGHAAWKTGTRGEHQTCESLVDVTTYALAEALVALYEAASGEIRACTIGGVLIGNFLITHVGAKAEAVVLGIGGLNGLSRAQVHATWHLVAWV